MNNPQKPIVTNHQFYKAKIVKLEKTHCYVE